MTTDFAGWLADLESSCDEIAKTALGLPGLEVRGRHGKPSREQSGAYLGLVGPTGAVQIGLASDAAGCQAFAKGLLGMGPAEPDLSPPEVADAVCEVINIVAGAFKNRVRDRAHPLQMGLPVFFHGGVQATEHTAVSVADVSIGGIPAAVVLVHPRGGPEA